jgi:hypothetical protein
MIWHQRRHARSAMVTVFLVWPLLAGVASGQSIKVSVPNKAVNWGIGSHQTITWAHTLGAGSLVRIERLTYASDGTIASVETIADAVVNAKSSGAFAWTVTGPASGAVRIRVSSVATAATDVSDVTFAIAPAFVQVASPAAGTRWGVGTTQTQQWKSNLGPGDLVDVQLGDDGGATFSTLLGSSPAQSGKLTFVVPAVVTTTARTRVRWTNPPPDAAAEGVNPGNFSIAALSITVASPNGGEQWEAGTTRQITWTSTYAKTDHIRLELSLDDGNSYPIVLAADTKNDGKHDVVVDPAWATTSAVVRIRVLTAGGLSDTSNQRFTIFRGLLLTNGSLTLVASIVNGAIRAVSFAGADFYASGTAVSDYGFQNGTDTATFRRNTASVRTGQPVTVTWTDTEVVVQGVFTGGGVTVSFDRRYSLVPEHDVVRVSTTLTNLGPATVLSCFDTFDPDQGVARDLGRSTYNDVYVLEGATVGRATDMGGLTVVMGSTHPAVTVAAGNPFWIDSGLTLNGFFDAPFDGDGARADMGLHVGVRLFLPAGATETFTYDQAYGTSIAAAEAQFVSVPR